MASQPTQDTPFGLDQNVAAGLAYLLGPVGGIVMIAGGGTNHFVKWAAAQSITLWATAVVLRIALSIVGSILHFLILIIFPVIMLVGLLMFAAWLWTSITAFQGKEVRVPIVADLTTRLFASIL
ncbi:MAG TPA: hypothetical protein VMW12_13305 [Candidatus Dormibacteraeota bacterium]|nr:hypothetical protein [Candidatus Dormibacteraeota bacterium]